MARKKRLHGPLVDAFLEHHYADTTCARIKSLHEKLVGKKLNDADVARLRRALLEIHSGLVRLGSLAKKLEKPPTDEEIKKELGL